MPPSNRLAKTTVPQHLVQLAFRAGRGVFEFVFLSWVLCLCYEELPWVIKLEDVKVHEAKLEASKAAEAHFCC